MKAVNDKCDEIAERLEKVERGNSKLLKKLRSRVDEESTIRDIIDCFIGMNGHDKEEGENKDSLESNGTGN